jgi:hypothetical protein
MLPSLRATRLESGRLPARRAMSTARLDQVHQRVVQQQLQREPAGGGARGAKGPGQQAAEADGRGNAQLALRLVAVAFQRLLGRARGSHHRGAALDVARAGLGERELAGGAVQQRQAQRAFELAQMLADGRGRHAQAPRGGGQRARRHHLGKDGHALELVHGKTSFM